MATDQTSKIRLLKTTCSAFDWSRHICDTLMSVIVCYRPVYCHYHHGSMTVQQSVAAVVHLTTIAAFM